MPTPPQSTPLPSGPWSRFQQRHLFDYPPAATALWLLIAAAGMGALLWAALQLLMQPPDNLVSAGIALALVALAAMFPVQIPRSTQSVLMADVFVLTILATLGVPAAVLAAGVEGLVGGLRSSKRLTTWVSGPSAAMSAMAVCGGVFTLLHAALSARGVAADMAAFAALPAVALLSVALTTGPLLWMLALKRSQALSLADWFAASSWVAAIHLGSAFVAGLVHLNAQRHGSMVLAVAATLAIALVMLLRSVLRRQDTDRLAQENLIAQAQREAEISQQRFMASFTHAAIGMAIVRADGQVLQVNRALCTLLERTEAEILGAPFSDVLHAGDAALCQRRVVDVIAREDAAFSMELRCRGDFASDRWTVMHCSRYEDPGGAGQCLIYQLHDISSRRQAESRLHHIAYHDGLTDLANRNCFQERLEVAVERSRLDADARFAVLFLDLDRFKIVNDSLGHIAGNHLLREVARRLLACVGESDLVARLGGDEFAILLEPLKGMDDGLQLAERVLAALAEPVSINGTELLPAASVGITFSDLGYRTVDEVLRDADLAMYEAKAAGRGRIASFDSSMHERVAEKLALESDLRHAIGEGQLSVHFQPLYELEPYRISGFEALTRWTHPQRGPISPAVFIALAEETGHIEALTSWVIDHAVAQLAHWHQIEPAMAHLGMHVNISGRDLARPDLVSHVGQVLQRHGLAAHHLTLEITETTLMGQLDVALKTLHALRATGVHFSIDDFGTGYSSLAYLSTLPISSLKIDRSFVLGLGDKPENVEIVRAVLNLGRSLGKKVIAEGIETAEQLVTLRTLGVPVGQGYLLSRPLRSDQVPALLKLGMAVAA